MFFHEWIGLAAISIGVFVFGASYTDGKIEPVHLVTFTLVGVVGVFVGPFAVGYFFYRNTGEIKSRRYVLIADVIGLFFLIGIVATGVRIYG